MHNTFKFKKNFAKKCLENILQKESSISFEDAASMIAYKINEETALSCSLQSAKDILKILTCSIGPYEIQRLDDEKKITIRVERKSL